MNIGINSEDVKVQAQQITGQGLAEFTQLRTFLDTIVKTRIPELWKGAGSEAYVTRYEALAPSFNAIEELITDIGEGLIKNATFYEEADQAASTANAGA